MYLYSTPTSYLAVLVHTSTRYQAMEYNSGVGS